MVSAAGAILKGTAWRKKSTACHPVPRRCSSLVRHFAQPGGAAQIRTAWPPVGSLPTTRQIALRLDLSLSLTAASYHSQFTLGTEQPNEFRRLAAPCNPGAPAEQAFAREVSVAFTAALTGS